MGSNIEKKLWTNKQVDTRYKAKRLEWYIIAFSGGNTWDQQVGMYDVPDIQIYNMRTGEWKKGRVSFDRYICR